jgi:orotate phosphoribosyltransferase
VLCLVDREQGGKERLEGYKFIPILTSAEILSDPKIQAAIAQSSEPSPL